MVEKAEHGQAGTLCDISCLTDFSPVHLRVYLHPVSGKTLPLWVFVCLFWTLIVFLSPTSIYLPTVYGLFSSLLDFGHPSWWPWGFHQTYLVWQYTRPRYLNLNLHYSFLCYSFHFFTIQYTYVSPNLPPLFFSGSCWFWGSSPYPLFSLDNWRSICWRSPLETSIHILCLWLLCMSYYVYCDCKLSTMFATFFEHTVTECIYLLWILTFTYVTELCVNDRWMLATWERLYELKCVFPCICHHYWHSCLWSRFCTRYSVCHYYYVYIYFMVEPHCPRLFRGSF